MASRFAIMANEEDTFYKGTLKVFDLEARKYVDGLEFTKGSDSSFAQVGDNILTDLGDKDTVYSPDGKAVYTEQGSLYYNSEYLQDRIDLETVIMDANGKELSRIFAVNELIEKRKRCDGLRYCGYFVDGGGECICRLSNQRFFCGQRVFPHGGGGPEDQYG